MSTKTTQKKQVPELRFPGLSGEWTLYKINELVKAKILDKVVDGNHGEIHPKSSDFVQDGGIPFVMANSVVNGRVNFKKASRISRVQADSLQKGFSINGDVLLTHKGSIGMTAIVPELKTDYIMLTPQVTYYRVIMKDKLSNYFLRYTFDADYFQNQLRINSGGGTRAYIGITEQGKLNLYLPEIEEQQKIADFLGSVDAWIDNLRSQKTALETYKRGMMQKLFTQQVRFKDDNGNHFTEWNTRLLGDIAKIATGSSNREGSTDTGQYRLFDRSTDERWTTDYELDAEALIVAGEGLTFKPRYYNGKFALHQRAYAVINNNSAANWSYLYYFITFHHQWFRRMAVGTTMPSLRMDAFTKMEIKLPDKGEQHKIADFLNSVDRTIAAKAEEITRVEQWKQGLMQKMFV